MKRLNEDERVCLIMNPKSGGGATAGRVNAVRSAASRWFTHWELWETERPGHATELATRAVEQGFDLVVAIGGDGTAHEVVNGLFVDGTPKNPMVVFSVIPAGTGSDLIKSLGTPKHLDLAMGVVAHGETRRCDVGRVEVTDLNGRWVDELFINVAGFGLNGEVVHRVNRSRKLLGGTFSFVKATVQSLIHYEAPQIDLQWTDERGEAGHWCGSVFSVFVGNGAYCGGGMWVGPEGAMDDGLLDLTIIPSMHLVRTAVSSPRLFNGTIKEVKGVICAKVVSLVATVPEGAPVLVDLDGEQPGQLPITIGVLSQRLNIRGRWSKSR